MKIVIRPARAADAAVIAEHNRAMAAETEGLQLEAAVAAEGVKAVLEDPGKGFYTVAEAGGRLIGQMMITFEWSDWRNGVFWWIQSVYVQPEFRGRGVFGELYRHILALARADRTVCGVRLYVEAGNDRARRVYEHLGMRRTSYGIYEVDFVLGR